MAKDVASSCTEPTFKSSAAKFQSRTLLGIFALAAAYFGAARLGLSMAVSAEQVSAVWPPTGVALAAVLVFGYRMWPAITLGAFAANSMANEPVVTAFGIAVGNTLEVVVGAWLLMRCVNFDTSLERLKDVLGLIVLAAGISTTISATIGMLSLCLGGVQSWTDFGPLWIVWWLGDAMGDLVIAPLLLTTTKHLPAWSLKRVAESSAIAIGLAAVGLIVFNGAATSESVNHSLAYTVFPFVIWAAHSIWTARNDGRDIRCVGVCHYRRITGRRTVRLRNNP